MTHICVVMACLSIVFSLPCWGVCVVLVFRASSCHFFVAVGQQSLFIDTRVLIFDSELKQVGEIKASTEQCIAQPLLLIPFNFCNAS